MTREKLEKLNKLNRELTLQEQQYDILRDMDESTVIYCSQVGSVRLTEEDRKDILTLLYNRYEARIKALKEEFENA